jgi:hypothetical protein
MAQKSSPTRREFVRLTAMSAATMSLWGALERRAAAGQVAAGAAAPVLDLAEWTNGYVGLETAVISTVCSAPGYLLSASRSGLPPVSSRRVTKLRFAKAVSSQETSARILSGW